MARRLSARSARSGRSRRNRRRNGLGVNPLAALAFVAAFACLFAVYFALRSDSFRSNNTDSGASTSTEDDSGTTPPPGGSGETFSITVDEGKFDPAWALRKRKEWRWMEALRTLAAEVPDSQLQQIVKLMDERSILASPRPFPERIELWEKERTRDWVAIVPLIEGDKEIDNDWQRAWGSSAAAFVGDKRDHGVVVLHANLDWTDAWRALVFGHEFSHVQDGQIYTHAQLAATERRAEEATFRWMEYKCGRKLRILAAKYIDRLVDVLRTGGVRALSGSSPHETMDSIFGESLSSEEAGIRSTRFWIYTSSLAIEKYYPKDEWETHKKEFYMVWTEDNISDPIWRNH